jgi:hypothetical protein
VALYSKGKGRYTREYDALWERLVPKTDAADTLQGELVRSIGRLASECYRNGNGNWNRFYRTFTTFLRRHLRDRRVFDSDMIEQIEQDIQAIRNRSYCWRAVVEEANEEDAYDRLTDRVVGWCRARPELVWLDKRAKAGLEAGSIADLFP